MIVAGPCSVSRHSRPTLDAGAAFPLRWAHRGSGARHGDTLRTRAPEDRSAEWIHWRERFPLLKRKVYLNSCAYGALAESVREASARYLASREEYGCAWDQWVGRYEGLRVSVAALLGGRPEEIALTASVSAAPDALASGLRFDGPRWRIVITDLEFPTHGQIWHAQAARGAAIVQIASREGWVSPERFAEAVDERTLLIATSEVCYRNGARLPIAQIADIAHRNGALFEALRRHEDLLVRASA